MKVVVIGNGGREHAIIKKINQSPLVDKVFALPGNGGISKDAECVNIGPKDISGVVNFCLENSIDFVIVSPDDPLVLGMVDELEKVGISCFGPNKKAAIIEGSKVFSKNLMKKYNIPTAKYEIFNNSADALCYLNTISFPIVIKADGLALGKGVIIAKTLVEAQNAVKSIMENKIFGDSGSNIVIEEFLEGPEVSVLAFTDGKTLVPMVSSMDHKRALDNDKGLNTGGMGTIAPNPYYTKKIEQECMEKIFIPTINAMRSEGRPFSGCLYFGLMLTKTGPKVIEYNCRFGDPEAQVVLPLLETDLFEIMLNISKKTLDKVDIKFSNNSACCVIVASGGYPEKYNTGYEIFLEDTIKSDLYFAGVKLDNNKLVTSGGRVVGVTSVDTSLVKAISNAYSDVSKVHFENSYFRTDIGKGGLKIGI